MISEVRKGATANINSLLPSLSVPRVFAVNWRDKKSLDGRSPTRRRPEPHRRMGIRGLARESDTIVR